MVGGISLLITGLTLPPPIMTMTTIKIMRENILGKLTIGMIKTTVRINYIIRPTDLKKAAYTAILKCLHF